MTETTTWNDRINLSAEISGRDPNHLVSAADAHCAALDLDALAAKLTDSDIAERAANDETDTDRATASLIADAALAGFLATIDGRTTGADALAVGYTFRQ